MIYCLFFLLLFTNSNSIQAGVRASIFSPNGKYIASGDINGSVKVWNSNNGKLIANFSGHTKEISDILFSSDSNYMFSSSYDKTIRIWSIIEKKLLHTLRGHTEGISSIDISDNGNFLVSGSRDESIKVWNINNYKLLRTINVHSMRINSVDIAPDGERIISAIDDYIYIWNIKGKQLKKIDTKSQFGVLKVKYTPDTKHFIAGLNQTQNKPTIIIFDSKTAKQINQFRNNDNAVTSLDISHDGKYLVVCGFGSYIDGNSDVNIWDIKTGTKIHEYGSTEKFYGRINKFAVSFSPLARKILAGASDGTIRIWNFDSEKELLLIYHWNAKAINKSIIRKIQSYLNSCGYDVGNPDGIFGKKTRNSIKKFQHDHYLEVDLNPTEKLLDSLYRINKPKKKKEFVQDKVYKQNIVINNNTFIEPESIIPKPSPIIERRLALVIGNSKYRHGGNLANSVNDAIAMKNVLEKLGFKVLKCENGNQKKMKKAIDEFGKKLKSYNVGLFFYAGHGIQVRGNNYLIPIGAKLENENDVEYDTVRADRVLSKMESAGCTTNIVILDACRDNPFERTWRRNTKGIGLAFMNAPAGSIIAYATSPGSTASDGIEKNGIYTSAILDNIQIPNITIEQMFKRVRQRTIELSNNKQVPWETTSLRGNFYFLKR